MSSFEITVKCTVKPDLMIGVTTISFPQPMHFSLLDSLVCGVSMSLLVPTSSLLWTAVFGGVVFLRTCFWEKETNPVP